MCPMIGLHEELLIRNKGTVVFIPISHNARFNRRRLAGVLNVLHLDIELILSIIKIEREEEE
jgi:hypothetical protein